MLSLHVLTTLLFQICAKKCGAEIVSDEIFAKTYAATIFTKRYDDALSSLSPLSIPYLSLFLSPSPLSLPLSPSLLPLLSLSVLSPSPIALSFSLPLYPLFPLLSLLSPLSFPYLSFSLLSPSLISLSLSLTSLSPSRLSLPLYPLFLLLSLPLPLFSPPPSSLSPSLPLPLAFILIPC